MLNSDTNTLKFESELMYSVPGKFSRKICIAIYKCQCFYSDPIGDIYSCKHAVNLPNVKVDGKIDGQIMTLSWEIIGSYNVPNGIQVFITTT